MVPVTAKEIYVRYGLRLIRVEQIKGPTEKNGRLTESFVFLFFTVDQDISVPSP